MVGITALAKKFHHTKTCFKEKMSKYPGLDSKGGLRLLLVRKWKDVLPLVPGSLFCGGTDHIFKHRTPRRAGRLFLDG